MGDVRKTDGVEVGRMWFVWKIWTALLALAVELFLLA